MSNLVYGVAVNDADYVVRPKVSGKEVWCPFYLTWKNMLRRCYSSKRQLKTQSYIGCTVDEAWLTFSNFKAWMKQQDWVGKELDKDILTVGNKVYSPNSCVFVDRITNAFTTDCGAARGNYPIGASLHKASGKFKSQCSNPFTLKYEHLGYFNCPNKAHQAWRKRKHELACQLAELQADKRVAEALLTMYA